MTLSLSKKPAIRMPSLCNVNNLEAISDFMVAFNVQKQPMYGCFHPERVGKLATDVHIIDLQVSSHPTSALYNSAEETVTSPVVFFSVAPKKQDGKSESNPPPPRNLTVIL